MRVSWKKALYWAAQCAYSSEVLDTQMKEILIGEQGEYESKEDWVEQRVNEWIEYSQIKAE